MKKYVSIIVIGLILLILCSGIGSSINMTSHNVYASSEPESHVIEGVPYAKQKGNRYCFFASMEMVYQFYGINVSKFQLLFESGGGYSLAYQPNVSRIIGTPHIWPPWKFKIYCSGHVTQGIDDEVFQASLHGCELEHWKPNINNMHFKKWKDYWAMAKDYIDNDIPVLTSIDPLAWPLYMELMNYTKTPLLYKAGHVVLLLGYNESNNTICFSDPFAGVCGYPEKGYYQWVSIDDFKYALKRSFWDLVESNAYELIVIKNTSTPLSEEEGLIAALDRNIERMKGNTSSYDSKFMIKDFDYFGIEALKQLKNDFTSNVYYKRLPVYWLIYKFTKSTYFPFNDMIGYYKYEADVKRDMAQYLSETIERIENESLIQRCEYDIELLQNESQKFMDLTNHSIDLMYTMTNNSLLKAYSESVEIIDDIVTTLDEIILIEEAIIAGFSEE